jgi:hypothetical protein
LKRSLGEGDVLEMEVGDGALPLAREVFGNVTMMDHTLTARGHGLIEKLPLFLEKMRVARISQSETKLRTNTLEDIFLNLTGRRLRE